MSFRCSTFVVASFTLWSHVLLKKKLFDKLVERNDNEVNSNRVVCVRVRTFTA